MSISKISILILALLTVATVFLYINKKNNVRKIPAEFENYIFENDERIIGEWRTVKFIKSIEDFKPGDRVVYKDLYNDKITVKENGKLYANIDDKKPWFKWTKGMILNIGDYSVQKYQIKEINGKEYLFVDESKSLFHKMGEIEEKIHVFEKYDILEKK